MISSARDHHANAEQLLERARAEQDSIRRHLILAEAQVHATLALGAPAERSPGQDEADGTMSTEVAYSGVPEGSGPFEMQPYSSSAAIRRAGGATPSRLRPYREII
jgi:hypothetical protein